MSDRRCRGPQARGATLEVCGVFRFDCRRVVPEHGDPIPLGTYRDFLPDIPVQVRGSVPENSLVTLLDDAQHHAL
jgi:hypothetical protein